MELSEMVRRENGYLRIILPDAISMGDGEDLHSEICKSVRDDNDLVVIDLSKTHVIYSSGFGLLIRIRKSVSEKNGAVCLVNVSQSVSRFFTDFNLERVFKIYSTDIEFELDNKDIWRSRFLDSCNAFVFAAHLENKICRITISGHMTALNDFKTLNEFEPMDGVKDYLVDFENMEIIDTFGSQLCNEFVAKVRSAGGRCVLFGLKSIASDLFGLFSDLSRCSICETEEEALRLLK